jgi:hypothetical protein
LQIAVEEVLLGSAPEELVLVVLGGEARFKLSEAEAREIGIMIQPREPTGSLEGLPVPAPQPVVGDLQVRMWVNRPVVEVGSRVMFAARLDSGLSAYKARYTAGTFDGGALFYEIGGQWVHLPTGLAAGESEVRPIVIELAG